MTIHRTDCINVLNLDDIERARLLDAEWGTDTGEETAGQYLAEIKLFANDRAGLLLEISKIFTEQGLDVKSMNVRTSKQGTATIEVGFAVHGREELKKVVEKLRQIEGVLDIERAVG